MCTAYMSIMFGVDAHLFLSLTFSVSTLDLACGGLCSLANKGTETRGDTMKEWVLP